MPQRFSFGYIIVFHVQYMAPLGQILLSMDINDNFYGEDLQIYLTLITRELACGKFFVSQPSQNRIDHYWVKKTHRFI